MPLRVEPVQSRAVHAGWWRVFERFAGWLSAEGSKRRRLEAGMWRSAMDRRVWLRTCVSLCLLLLPTSHKGNVHAQPPLCPCARQPWPSSLRGLGVSLLMTTVDLKPTAAGAGTKANPRTRYGYLHRYHMDRTALHCGAGPITGGARGMVAGV